MNPWMLFGKYLHGWQKRERKQRICCYHILNSISRPFVNNDSLTLDLSQPTRHVIFPDTNTVLNDLVATGCFGNNPLWDSLQTISLISTWSIIHHVVLLLEPDAFSFTLSTEGALPSSEHPNVVAIDGTDVGGNS